MTVPSADPSGTQKLASWALLAARSSAPSRTLHVSPFAGPASADGSAGLPFNLTSAALSGADNGCPLAQAADFARNNLAPNNRAEEMAGIIYCVRGGEYPQSNIVWPGFSSQSIIVDGPARFGATAIEGTTNWTFAASSVAFGSPQFPILSMGQSARPGTVQVFANLVLSNGSSGQLVGLKSADISWFDISESALTGLSLVFLDGGSVESINVPSALLYYNNPSGGFIENAVIVGRLQRASMAHFRDAITVSTTPLPPDDDGIISCRIDGGWTGPAGTARFDEYTQDQFLGVFAGGAGPADYLELKTAPAIVGTEPGAVQTTDATPAVIWSLTLADNTAYWVDALVVARGTAASQNGYQRRCVVSRRGAGAALGGAGSVSIWTDEDDLDWDVEFVVSGNDLRLQVTGEAATTIDWSSTAKFQVTP